MTTKNYWFTGKVFQGNKLGKTIGYPTANLDPNILSPIRLKPGVYAAKVIHKGKNYSGILFFGPRTLLCEQKNILEIHVLEFKENLYDKEISFFIGDFIRDVMKFDSLEQLKNQLQKDVQNVVKYGR